MLLTRDNFRDDLLDGLRSTEDDWHPVISATMDGITAALHPFLITMDEPTYWSTVGRLAASLDGLIVTTSTIVPSGD